MRRPVAVWVDVVTVPVRDACDAGKLGESMRQIVVKGDRQRAVVNPQVVARGILFTNLHVSCVVVVACGGPCHVATDGKFKGGCGLRCGSVGDLVLFRRGKPWDQAQRRSGAT